VRLKRQIIDGKGCGKRIVVRRDDEHSELSDETNADVEWKRKGEDYITEICHLVIEAASFLHSSRVSICTLVANLYFRLPVLTLGC
jgi:hypothetical protein